MYPHFRNFLIFLVYPEIEFRPIAALHRDENQRKIRIIILYTQISENNNKKTGESYCFAFQGIPASGKNYYSA